MIKNVLGLLLIVLLLVAGQQQKVCASEEMTPGEILQRTDESRGNLEGIQWKVIINSIEKGREQKRKIKVKAKGYDFLALLTAPPKVKGQKLLMIDHNMWFAKPGLKKPVPISPRQKLIGGATYGDIAATNYSDDYEATPLEDATIDGELCFVFDLKSIQKKTTYDRIVYWVSRERLVGVKAEYYTVSGKLFKTAWFEYDNQVILRKQQHPFISKMIITDALIKDNVTTLIFSDNKMVKVPDATFDLNLFMMN